MKTRDTWQVMEAERLEIARESLRMSLADIAEAHCLHVRTVRRCLERPEIIEFVETLRADLRQAVRERNLRDAEAGIPLLEESA